MGLINARKMEHIKTKLEVLTAVLIKIHVFWDLTPCGVVNVKDTSKVSIALVIRVEQFKKSSGLLAPEEEDTTLCRHEGNYLPVRTA